MTNDSSNIGPANPIFGTPDQDATLTPESYQGYSDTCAIRSQQLIMGQFGINLPQEQLMFEARERGWYTPGQGTSMENIGNLLELHGVPVHRYSDANVFNLASELAQGHKVIVGVESDELWRQNPLLIDLNHALGIPPQADHALIVTGIDTTDMNHIKVDIMDPGTGDVCKQYPLEQFLNAWQGSNFFMVATENPAPPTLPEMQNFDYNAGHLSQIGHMAYHDCESLFAFACPGPHLIHKFMEGIMGGEAGDPLGGADHDSLGMSAGADLPPAAAPEAIHDPSAYLLPSEHLTDSLGDNGFPHSHDSHSHHQPDTFLPNPTDTNYQSGTDLG